jgi:hypothetical protein
MRPLLLLTLLFCSTRLDAQTLSAEELNRRVTAHAADFDYLLGEWEFNSVSKEWGAGGGAWTAVKLEGGQILDEYRVLGDSGQTWYFTHTIRAYNARKDHWDMVGLDYGTGLGGSGFARRTGGEVHIEQRFANARGPDAMARITYYDITPDSFRWKADRSTDGGKTWVREWLTIEAKRIGPPRTFVPLTAARGSK